MRIPEEEVPEEAGEEDTLCRVRRILCVAILGLNEYIKGFGCCYCIKLSRAENGGWGIWISRCQSTRIKCLWLGTFQNQINVLETKNSNFCSILPMNDSGVRPKEKSDKKALQSEPK